MVKKGLATTVLIILLAGLVEQTLGCATAMQSCLSTFNRQKSSAGSNLSRLCPAYNRFVSCLDNVTCTGIYSSLQSQLDSLVRQGRDNHDKYCSGYSSAVSVKMSLLAVTVGVIVAAVSKA